MTYKEIFIQPTCVSPRYSAVYQSLDIIVVICALNSNQINIFNRSTGTIIYNQKMKKIIDDNLILFNILQNNAYFFLDSTGSSGIPDTIQIFDLSQFSQTSLQISLERNKFLKESIQIDFPEKIIYFIGLQALYKYSFSKKQLQVSIKNFQKLRQIQFIQNNLYVIESAEQLLMWDNSSQIVLSSYLIDSTQVEIVDSQISSDKIFINLIIIKKPQFISLIQINNGFNSTSLQIIETFSYISGISECINVKFSKFILVTTQDGYLNILKKNSTKIILKQQLFQGQRFELVIVPQCNFLKENSIYFICTFRNRSITMYEFNWVIDSQGMEVYFLNNIFSKQFVQFVSQIIFNLPTFLVNLNDYRIIFEFDLRLISNSLFSTPITQYTIPFTRNFINLKVYQDLNKILVYTDFSFAIFTFGQNFPYFTVIDDTFVNNQIKDIVMISPEIAVISTKLNILIVELDFSSQFSSLSNKLKYLYTSGDQQVNIINANMQKNSSDQRIFTIFGYSLYNNEIIDFFIPIESNSCAVEFQNPNFFVLQEKLTNLKESLADQDEQIIVQIQLSNEDSYSPQLILPYQNGLNNMTLILSGQIVLLDKINFEGVNKMYSTLKFSNATIFFCNKNEISGFSKVIFNNSEFKIGNCSDNQQKMEFYSFNLIIKDIKEIEIINCKINQQIVKNSSNKVLDILNIENVVIQNLEFEQNQFLYLSNPLIYVFNITKLSIQQVSIKDNHFINPQTKSVILLELVQTLNISQFFIISNIVEIRKENYFNILYVLKLNGVIQFNADSIHYLENKEIGLLDISPIVQNGSEQRIFSNLQVQITNSHIKSNNIILSQLIPVSIFSVQTLKIIRLGLDMNYTPSIPLIFLHEINDAEFQFLEITNNTSNSTLLIVNIQKFHYNNGYAKNNTSINQGAVLHIRNEYIMSLDQNRSLIEESQFLNNIAKMHGGAIFSHLFKYDIKKTQFLYNKATVGGAIYYEGIQPIFARNQNSQRILENQYEFKSNLFYKNTAKFFGNNIGSKILQIVIDSRKTLDELVLENIQSGQVLSDLYLYVVDEENQSINTEFAKKGDYGFLTSQIIKDLVNSLIVEIQSGNETELDAKENNILNLSENNAFNMKGLRLTGVPGGQTSYLIFNIPFIGHYDQQGIEKIGKQVKVPITFRDCVIGEIYVKMSPNIFKCLECTDNKYSIEIPVKDSVQVCKQCNKEGFDKCNKNQIFIKPGYWKWNISSENPIQCYNQLSNCDGEHGTNFCSPGYIGPLCETCDYNGKIWGERYGRYDNFSCNKCENSYKIIGWQLLLSLPVLSHLVYSIRKSMQKSIKQINSQTLRRLNWVIVGKTGSTDYLSTYIKFLMNFLQIVQMIPLKDTNIYLQFLSTVLKIFGNPLESFSKSLDCIFSLQNIIPIEYMRVIWSTLIPLLLISTVFIGYLIVVYFHSYWTFETRYIYVTLSFSLLYFQSGVLSQIITVISCKNIDGIQLIQAELVKECYTQEHITYIYSLIIILFIIWIIIPPLLVFISLFKGRKNLDSPFKIIRFSFYYNEFKDKYYYWEFVRMTTRVLVILVGNIWSSNDEISWKYGISVVIINSYGLLSRSLNPFRNIHQNQFDYKLTQITNMLFLFWLLFSTPQQLFLKQISELCYLLILSYSYFIIFNQIFSSVLESSVNLQLLVGRVCPYVIQHYLFSKRSQNVLRKFILWRRLRMKFKLEKNLFQSYTIQTLQDESKAGLLKSKFQLQTPSNELTQIYPNGKDSFFKRQFYFEQYNDKF